MSGALNPFEPPRAVLLVPEAIGELRRSIATPGLGVNDLIRIAGRIIALIPALFGAIVAFQWVSSGLGSWLATMPFAVLGSIVATSIVGLLIRIVLLRAIGRAIGWERTSARSLGDLFVSVFGVGFMVGLFVMFGLLLFVVPGVVVMVRYLFYPECIVLDEADDAMAESKRLVTGDGLRVFGYGLAHAFVFIVLGVVVAVMRRFEVPMIAIEAVRLALSVVTAAWSIVFIALYLHLAATKPREVAASATDLAVEPNA